MNIAIITGASSGMGREFAKQLSTILTKTDEIWLLAKRKDPLDMLAIELTKEIEIKKNEDQLHKAHQIKIRTISVDISDEKKLAHFAEVLMIRNPAISVLVNCAGTGIYGSFDKQSRDEVTQTVRLNVVGLTQLTKYCLPYMRKGSKIIQVASAAAFSSQPNFSVYAASKSYVYSFSKALAKELKSKGILVTVVCPGPVDTPFLSNAYGRYGEMNCFKKLTISKADKVVHKALVDCKKKKTVSVYGIPMKLVYMFARL
ncbi:MAG: SDR family NAD(P)-dependent oxidoreductase [Lachnospiraceae bacterium]|nr:SDR family NAD(P)-dependent oxidoreductase [Lachnospiraceae bacterium]